MVFIYYKMEELILAACRFNKFRWLPKQFYPLSIINMRVADYLIEYIYSHGTETIFTLSGGGAMFLNDATIAHGKIKYICSHHEQACALAAEAYAKTKNVPGAVIVTSGPGSTNAITGLLEAWQNSISVIFISTQTKKSQMSSSLKPQPLRQFGVQEVNIIPVVKSLTKYAAVVENPEDIKQELDKAYCEMLSDRPGPVWLDIPSDVAGALIDEKKLKSKIIKQNNKPQASQKKIEEVFTLLKKAKKPIIIAGGGVRLANAVEIFRKLVEKTKIPVVTPDMGIDLLEYDHPNYIGHGGTKGDRAGNIIIQDSDLILAVGTRLAVPFTGHEYDKWAPKAKKIVIDVDPLEHSKNTIKIDKLILSDAKYFLEKILVHAKSIQNKQEWLKKCQIIKKKYSLFLPKPQKKLVNMYHAINAISQFSKKGDHIITDAGVTAYITTQTLKIKKNQRFIIPGATLTMGYNLPAILGVWAASPKNNIICITGDGSFQMNIHELASIFHHKIPAKIFVINNQGYLAIRITQKNFFNQRLIGEGLKSGVYIPETQKIAKAYGIKYFKINKTQDLKKIKDILELKETVICEIVCPYWQDILTVSSRKDENGKMMSLPINEMFPFLSKE
ncbi:thiamine pyrophosphate-binding protein [Candidatus Beckwithbacteria bacterium]|nr:thiamine pyrophosphate-binding protein [Candidatus Beckwithbacteria bacterium]